MSRNAPSKKPEDLDPIAWRDRLLRACAAYREPPTFQPGDIVTHNPDLYPSDDTEQAFKHGIVPILVVIEAHPSWRFLCVGDKISDDMPADSQAVLVGQIDTDGSFISSWASSHSFIPATADLFKPRDGTTNLNH